jgi:hypothetical protein
LSARWQAELTDAGYPPDVIAAEVESAGADYQPPVVDLDELASELLGPGGRLAAEKTFTRGDVIIAVAPHLHGLPVSVLDEAAETVLEHRDAIALPIVTGSRKQVWAARCVLADEEAIATLAESLTGDEGPGVEEQFALEAVHRLEERLGASLTATQKEVAVGLMTSGHRLEVVIGVGGSGKTTTLAAVKDGFETAGYTVIGTATSGQAAKNLGDGAGIDSRTVASVTWRLDHNRLVLSDQHVLILDEGSMTTDVAIARLLAAVERSGAKLIVVGDDRQLGAIGPGRGPHSSCRAPPQQLWALGDNLRQTNPAERAALSQLRDGDIETAVAWYARNGRVHPAPDRRRAVIGMIRAWAGDIDAGRDSLLLAHRRDSVEMLNQAARRHRGGPSRLRLRDHWSSSAGHHGRSGTRPGRRRRPRARLRDHEPGLEREPRLHHRFRPRPGCATPRLVLG